VCFVIILGDISYRTSITTHLQELYVTKGEETEKGLPFGQKEEKMLISFPYCKMKCSWWIRHFLYWFRKKSSHIFVVLQAKVCWGRPDPPTVGFNEIFLNKMILWDSVSQSNVKYEKLVCKVSLGYIASLTVTTAKYNLVGVYAVSLVNVNQPTTIGIENGTCTHFS